MSFRINTYELPYSKPPYSYEYIKERPEGMKWRIKDSQDNAVGSAEDERSAHIACQYLNKEIK